MQDARRDHANICAAAAQALANVPAGCRPEVLVGFDGFIDHIIDIVDKRTDLNTYSRIETIATFGAKVSAAAGKSAGFGSVITTTKLGGNGPIMANALCAQDLPVTILGILGKPTIEPVFQGLASRAKRTLSLGPPAVTNALEFDDGKIMLNISAPLNEITFASITATCGGSEGLKLMLKNSAGIATINWTQTQGLTDIWRRMAKEVLPGLRSDRPYWFVDLCDPHRRTNADIQAGMQALSAIQAHSEVVLGLNESECRQLCDVYGIAYSTRQPEWEAARESCVALRSKLGLGMVMCHMVRSSAVAWSGGTAAAEGFFEPKPKITTGAGDHFNAGFFSALLSGVSPAHFLQIGAATSCHYVRTAESPTRAQLIALLRSPSSSEARG